MIARYLTFLKKGSVKNKELKILSQSLRILFYSSIIINVRVDLTLVRVLIR